MAREVIERLIDDLDGSEGAETVAFGLDGTTYEIDLSRKNAAVFRKSLERYVKAARRSSGPSSRSTSRRAAGRGRAASTRDYDLLQLREWAGANDIAIPSRGRIPQAVVEQYKAAGGR